MALYVPEQSDSFINLRSFLVHILKAIRTGTVLQSTELPSINWNSTL